MTQRNWTRKVERTDDGSSTFFIPEWNERYHSSHGALQEGMHVFIEMGLKLFSSADQVSIFEMGLGTGLNAQLTRKYKRPDQSVSYYSLEAFPVEREELKAFRPKGENEAQFFDFLHQSSWGEPHDFDSFSLQKEKAKLETSNLPQEKFDLVYFDAFGPRVQPELWTVEVFRKMHACMKPGGILVTYCAKGQVRRNMQEVGFDVERLPGPPGKREMLRASKSIT